MSENNIIEECIIEIDDFVNSMAMEQQGQAYISETQSPIIHKIRRHIYQKDENAYKPSNISIGPYHNGIQAVSGMQKMKWDYLNFLLDLNPEKKLADYIEAVSAVEAQVRSCYAGEIRIDKDSFVKMLLLDGCFLLLTFHQLDGIAEDKPAIAIEKMQADASPDNRENRGDCEYGQDDSTIIINMYSSRGRKPAFHLVNDVVQSMKEAFDCFPKVIEESVSPKEIHHMLQLFHRHFKPCQQDINDCLENVKPPSFQEKSPLSVSNFLRKSKKYLYDDDYHDQPVRGTQTHWWGATEYHKAGIKLQKREFNDEDPDFILNIRFRNNTLEVPCLTFNQEIAGLFQKIAFEGASPGFGNYITAYAVFWSQFSGTPDDVALLTERGIIVHHVSSDIEVANLFRGLGECAEFDLGCDHYLKALYHVVEVQCQNQWFLLQKILGSF